MATGDPRPDGMVWDDVLGWTMPGFNPAQTLQDSIDKARAWDALAEKNAEITRLRKGIQDYLDGNFGPDFPTKRDTCPHNRFGWEDCGQCIDEYFTALLAVPNGER